MLKKTVYTLLALFGAAAVVGFIARKLDLEN